MHYTLPLLVALTLSLGACSQGPSQGPASPSAGSATPVAGNAAEPALKIDPADATCSSNADCGMTMTQCSCDCGSPVNLARTQKYVEAQERMCKSYEGVMCKMACNDTLICDNGVCRIKK